MVTAIGRARGDIKELPQRLGDRRQRDEKDCRRLPGEVMLVSRMIGNSRRSTIVDNPASGSPTRTGYTRSKPAR